MLLLKTVIHLTDKLGRVPLDKNEGVVKAQNSCAVIFAPLACQSRWRTEACLPQASSETLTVNQLSAVRFIKSFRQPSIRP